ncbi:MAG: phosphoribosylanthranilate isomerase [Opitutaceae bacterium]|nr:phosphoribosylanthranilate isomerase [Opitutaceae bacterium]
MINGIRLKVCGLTSLVDAGLANGIGADYLGFIFYPKSPRYVTVEQYGAMSPRLPARGKIAVCVEPEKKELNELAGLDFDFIQIHFPAATPLERIVAWSQTTGAERLWLAPKLPPERDVEAAWLPLAGAFLLDAFHPDKFGGTGQTGDWVKFRRHLEAHPQKQWILSGGLGPVNIGPALAETGARMVDVNSGVERSPGVKDPVKLRALVEGLRRTRARL